VDKEDDVMRPPRLTLGLPVHDRERYLEGTLECLLGQTWGDFEIVVSDNASQDGTEQLCRGVAAHDRRVRYVRQPVNLGANGNFNAVARAASGELFKWVAHDDLLDSRYLAEVVPLLESSPQAVLAQSQTVLIDEQGVPLAARGSRFVTPDGSLYESPDGTGCDRRLTDPRPSVRFRDVLLNSRWCFDIFGVIRRPALLATGLQRGFYGTDKVVLAHLALQGTMLHVAEPLFLRRCHPATSTNLGLWQKVRWSDPDALVPLPPVVHMVAGYLTAAGTAPLPLHERLSALRAVGVKAAARQAAQASPARAGELPRADRPPTPVLPRP